MDAENIKNLSNSNFLELLQILASINPDKQKLSLAQDILTKYIDLPQSLNTSLYILSSNEPPIIRQHAANILYKSIDHNWDDIPDTKKEEIKTKIIELYSKEKVYIILKAIGFVIFRICRKILLENKWDSILDLIFSSPDKYSQGQENLFEINLHIIADLVGSVSTLLKDKTRILEIKNILSTAFSQGNNKMKEHATECLGYLIQNLDTDNLDIFKDLADFLFKDLKNCDEKVISKVYETLCDCRLDVLNFFNDLENPTKVTIELLSDMNLKNNIKSMMVEFIFMISKFKKKIFTKNDSKYLKQLLKLSIELINSEENLENELMDEDYLSLYNIGLNIINILSGSISSKKTFPFLIEIIKKYIQSPKPLERKGAIAIIGEMAEGCAVPMKDNIEDIINLLINTFSNDVDEKVKGQCIKSMDYLSQFCSPEINEYYDKIIPMLLEGIYSNNEDIVEKSLLEINFFFSSINLEMEDYLNMNSDLNIKLLQKILELINFSKSGSIQSKALTALGAVVTNGHNLNIEILIPVLTSLQNITKTKNTANDQKLIGNTLDCVGNILTVIKKEKFSNELESYFNQFALECIKSSVYDLQLGGLSYFSALAEIKQQDFEPMLNDIMLYTEKILKDESGIIEKSKLKDEINHHDSDSEDLMEGNDELYWNQDFMEVKTIALKSLSFFAKACPKLYLEKYYQFTLDQLDFFSTYCNENLLFEVGDLYEAILISMENAKSDKEINDFWVNEALTNFESYVNETDDQELVGHIFGKMYNIINHYGKNIFLDKKKNSLNTSLDRIINLTMKLLKNELPCQSRNQGVEEDEYEHEEDIFDAVTNICVIISEKLCDDFHNYFNILYPEISKYLKTNYDEEDREKAFGIIAEVLKHTKISIKFYADKLFEDINKNLSGKKKIKNNENLFRHIAYLIGVLFEGDSEYCKKYVNQGLQNLQYIFEKTKKEGKDNVIAALCRIIMAYNYDKNNFNLFEKSIDNIMINLPLKYDNNENLTVLNFLIYIIEMLDLNQYKKYLNYIMKTLHCIVIFDAKCETKKEDFDKVKAYLNKLNQNEEIKNIISDIIEKEFTAGEKEKFIKNLS